MSLGLAIVIVTSLRCRHRRRLRLQKNKTMDASTHSGERRKGQVLFLLLLVTSSAVHDCFISSLLPLKLPKRSDIKPTEITGQRDNRSLILSVIQVHIQ